ncbi:hypothetical protein [Mesobacillus subterraneus]|uniref:Uncharacterized protein n=1 Tax=Mesobacillus subterraneus TaxID=285983 RepID=A0A3R9F3V7_9BACI|nr:hypothetical protein [Mesobacillus subterraneus]RSD28421.1 hypothetical protein EJA10_04870 [Mesobacillus subterraneus]
MEKSRIEQFDEIVKMRQESQQALNQYWLDNALYTSFEYWMMVSFLLVPLIILFFKIDKSKIFFMGFFGYSIHVLFGLVDTFSKNTGLLNYPFPVIPTIPGLSLETSLVPVTFMLVYQWTLNHQKNYYLYMGLTAAILAFAFKPFITALGLFKLYGNSTYYHLFFGYILIILGAKLITNIFLWTEKKYRKT